MKPGDMLIVKSLDCLGCLQVKRFNFPIDSL